ncbi:hypothetical protein BKA62DRAFT_696288 [Auriculariales sp. MPI-PUGE-AT-0066]|nr:hypothetical protein BKA62DRAFT_696288 [Auriculariales sp. MPI-PUGE-AT-0066]
MPFLVRGPEEWGGVGGRKALDEERRAAFEGFQMVLTGWGPAGMKEHMDRCLWLIRAARSRTADLGDRILNTLDYSLSNSPAASMWRLETVAPVMSMVSALLELQATTAIEPSISIRVDSVLYKFQDVQYNIDDVEQWYDLVSAGIDNQTALGPWAVRQAVWRDALVRSLELGSPGVRAWIIAFKLDELWDLPKGDQESEGGDWEDSREGFDDDDDDDLDAPRTPPPRKIDPPSDFVASITCASIHRLLRAMAAVLRFNPAGPAAALKIFTTRLLPFLQIVQLELWEKSRRAAIAVMFELLDIEQTARAAQQYLTIWSSPSDRNVWKADFEQELKDLVNNAEWTSVCRMFHSIPYMFDKVASERIILLCIPALHRRLVDGYLEPAHQAMVTELLQRLAAEHRQIFFKPVITCASAMKDATLVYNLRLIKTLARLLPDFWTCDAELMAIATCGEIGAKTKPAEMEFGKVRLGQCLLLLQLIEDVHTRVVAKKDLSAPPTASQSGAVRFFMDLEGRIAVLLNSREKTALVPFSHRNLVIALLYEIRLFVWSIKVTPWLPRLMMWTTQAMPSATRPSGQLAITKEVIEEGPATTEKLRELIKAVAEEAQAARIRNTRVTLLPTETVIAAPAAGGHVAPIFDLLPSQLAAGCARLLVLLFQSIDTQQYRQLGPVLWQNFLDSDDTSVLEPTAFLIMQAAEKHPELVVQVGNDLLSSSRTTRQQAVHRITVLFARRYQIMTQICIYDRRHKPFQAKRTVLNFVPADVGTGQFVLEEDEQTLRDRFGTAMPRETIKRLLEIDWVQENKPADKKLEMARTPFSALPSSQLDRGLDVDPEAGSSITPSVSGESAWNSSQPSPGFSSPSPNASSATQLLRRKSSTSTGGSASRRRPIFVSPLISILPLLARAVRDADIYISSMARDFIIDFMREDAGALCRPIMERLSANGLNIMSAVDDIRAFLHVQQVLPPVMTHYVFTHLAGFLRSMSKADRRQETANSLLTFSYTVPMLAKLISHVNNLGAQDLRRSKIEIFTLPTGPLWFVSSQAGPMFPRSLEDAGDVALTESLDELPGALVSITMIRTSQNMLLLSLLKRNPQDIVVVRKNLQQLVLPSRDAHSGLKQLELIDMVPRSPEAMRNKKKDLGLTRISLALSRSYLLLITEVFRCLPRGMSDRSELGRLLDGVCRILLTHGDDIGIVSHALAACMIAAIRFRRMFSGSSAFNLLMGPLIKVYCEATEQRAIRRAIEYAMSRFYQIHEDVLIYQVLDMASNMAGHPTAKSILPWLASGVVALISSLKSPPHIADGDAAGIHGVAEKEEKENYLATLVEKQSETLVAVLNGRTPAAGQDASPHFIAENAPHKTFPLENLPRFLMTVIAYEATTLRAEQFLRLMRCMMPYLYHSTIGARSPLDQGINSLGLTLFFKSPGGLQPGDLQPGVAIMNTDSNAGGVALPNPKAPCDPSVMREEYLNLVTAFVKAGGIITNPPAHRSLALVKIMMKEGAEEAFRTAERFTVEFANAGYTGGVFTRRPDQALQQLSPYAPIFQQYCDKCDFSGVLAVLERLCVLTAFAQDGFPSMVIRDFLRPAVNMSSKMAINGTLFRTNLRHTLVPLINTSLTLPGGDPIAAIEECTASPAFLAGVVLPLCLKLRTFGDIVDPTIRDAVRSAYSRAWMRLLSYSLSACQVGGSSAPVPNGDATRSATQTPAVGLATLAIVLQIIKIIVIRGEGVLSSMYPDVWNIIGSFLVNVLAKGNALFGFSSESQEPVRALSSLTAANTSPAHASSEAPRLVDYLMWSMMHFACAYRSPLMIQMRLRILESCSTLYEDLGGRSGSTAITGEGRRLSSTMFSKPRMRTSTAFVQGVASFTPGHSPRPSLTNSPGTPTKRNPFSPRSPDYLTLAAPPRPQMPERKSRYRYSSSPFSPGGMVDPFSDQLRTAAPASSVTKRATIRHLGLAPDGASKLMQPNASFMPGTAGAKADAITQLNNWACEQRVRTTTLARACVLHVRKVQMFMGYERMLLPLPLDIEEMLEEAGWTDVYGVQLDSETAAVLSGPQVLVMVSRETAKLIEEFRSECYGQGR